MMATKKDSENRAGLGTGVGGIRGCQNSRLVFVVVRPLIYQTGNRNFFFGWFHLRWSLLHQ